MAKPKVALEIGQGDERWGTIVLELEEAGAPETTKNFLEYVDAGFYSGAVFHRVIPNFMIQGGGYGAGQKTLPGARSPVKNEAKSGLKNERGTIAMARTSDPHSASSQFFINVADNDFLNYPGQDGWGYCAFGRVVDGMDVVERVEGVETRANPAMGESSAPVNPPHIIAAKRA